MRRPAGSVRPNGPAGRSRCNDGANRSRCLEDATCHVVDNVYNAGMTDTRSSVVSARVSSDVASRIEKLARAEGVTPSRFLEQLISKAVVRMEFHGDAGAAKLRLIGDLNMRNGRVLDHEHPGVSLWELDSNVWPRHFLHVESEYGLTENDGSSECWLLCQGDRVKLVEPDAYLKQQKKKGE